MDIDVEHKGQTAHIALTGELTIYTAAETKTGLTSAIEGAKDVEIDLSNVSEIDTAGLQLMLIAKRHPDKAVRFINHPPAALRLIDLANLGRVLGDPLVISAAKNQKVRP